MQLESKKKGIFMKMLHVANPIYDTVFKYLMEDERVARTVLSALLKKTVVSVEMRRHEYTNGSRERISMFRIDFAATVREDDGREQLVLIELQKTWVETETLRFRQYLGAHYANAENIRKDNNPLGHAIPMVAVYLLGHRVGDIEEPVVYVNRKAYDYNGREVTKGMPDPFINSLTHDCIIVQIPLLRNNFHNRLDKVLSIFDQTRKEKDNRQVLDIDEELYGDDEEMLYLLRRLLAAASESSVRQDMNVEDEYYSAIETRDTAILNRDKIIKERDKTIAEKDGVIAEKDGQIEAMKEAMLRRGMSREEISAIIGLSIT